MSNEQPDPNQTRSLHLEKFAPGKANPPVQPEPTSVTVVIKRAAADAAQSPDGRVIVPKEGGGLPAKEMLGAIAYCYAKGVYESDAIEDKMLRNPGLRESVAGEVPDANAIRRFRRLNRNALTQTLEKVFRFLRKKEQAELQQPLPGQPPNPAPVRPPDGESTIAFGRTKAEQTLEKAAFIDAASKD